MRWLDWRLLTDWHLYAGLAFLGLGAVGVLTNVKWPAKSAASGAVRGVYGLLNQRPLVKPFDKRAREIYDENR